MMKKTTYYVLLALGVGVAGYITTQSVLLQDEKVVMYGELDEARTKRASLQSMGCSATNAGTLRYNDGCFQYCDGKGAWINKSSACDAGSHIVFCIGLPENASWNTATSITQTWNGDEWTPTAVGSYNTTGSNSECKFTCNENYTYNGGNNTCVANTKTGQSCTSLVANAEWNTVSSITQTWDGSDREPITTGSYSTTGSTTECRFKCKDGYAWDEATSTCATTCKNGAIGIAGTAGHVRNPSNGTITITDGTCGFIIQDKNVGATTAGIGNSSAEIWQYFQWGNKCGFSNASVPSSTETRGTNLTVDSTYPPSCKGLFIRGEIWWNDTYNHTITENLWWNTTDNPLGTNRWARRWPCLTWYHVPSNIEREQLLIIWGKAGFWWTLDTSSRLYWYNNIVINTLKIPQSWCMDGRYDNPNIAPYGLCSDWWRIGIFLWTSSPSDQTAANLLGITDSWYVYTRGGWQLSSVGYPVRCFKDTNG